MPLKYAPKVYCPGTGRRLIDLFVLFNLCLILVLWKLGMCPLLMMVTLSEYFTRRSNTMMVHVYSLFGAITFISDRRVLWSKLMSVAKSQVSLQDEYLRTVQDQGVGTHAERLAAT